MPEKRYLETILGPLRRWVGWGGWILQGAEKLLKCRCQKLPIKVQKCHLADFTHIELTT